MLSWHDKLIPVSWRSLHLIPSGSLSQLCWDDCPSISARFWQTILGQFVPVLTACRQAGTPGWPHWKGWRRWATKNVGICVSVTLSRRRAPAGRTWWWLAGPEDRAWILLPWSWRGVCHWWWCPRGISTPAARPGLTWLALWCQSWLAVDSRDFF